jgi:hypothetical protein
MPGESSDKGADIALDAMTGRATQTARTTYLVLLTSAPSDTTTMGTMAELTAPASNGYARQAVTWNTPATDGAGARQSTNNGAVTFGAFSADLSAVTHVALVSASTGTGGDFIYYWTLDSSRDPANGDSIQFADQALVMKVD